MTYSDNGLYIDDAHLETFGENTARSLKLGSKASGTRASGLLMGALRSLRAANDALQRRYAGVTDIPQAAEWLLDNWYLAQREGLSAVRDLRSAGPLRLAEDSFLLLVLGQALVRSGQGRVTAERSERFLTGFQKACVLNRRELSLFPAAVRTAAILALAEVYDDLSDPAAACEQAGRLITTLRLMSTLDLSGVLERVDAVENILAADPAGVYPHMDEKTRESYRRRVSILSRRLKIQEHRVAQKVLKLSENARGEGRHVGYYLFTEPMGQRARAKTGGLYIAANVLLTLFFALLTGFLTGSPLPAVLLLPPVSELIKSLLDFFILRSVPPAHVPRMELRGGIPPEGRTLCVVSVLLTGESCGSDLSKKLEEYRLANRDAGENLLMGILADLPESTEENPPEHEQWVRCAAAAIEGLSSKYGGGFYFLWRRGTYCESDKKYMPFERKRGAIMELARLVTGAESSLLCAAGDSAALKGVRYILTLDNDTRLCPGTARELIGAMLHPLNTPKISEKTNLVISGHAVISPRMAVELESAGKSDFVRIFAGQGGTDPYGCASGELYMDLFSRGGFAGKGILDAEVLLRCAGDSAIPRGRVLSHDTLEGAILRGGFIGDVELSDCFPSSVMSYYKRMHRWTRGDWQNLPWLFHRGRYFSDVDRFKIYDNLRRSLVPPFTLLAILAGFLFPGPHLVWAAIAALLSFASRLFLTVADTMLRQDQEGRVRYHSTVIHGVGGGILQTVIKLILLPYEAWVCLSAICLSLWRMGISRRNLLNWQTAAQTDSIKSGAVRIFISLWPAYLAGLACLIFSHSILAKAAGILWILSPLLILSLGRPRIKRYIPSPEDTDFLLNCAADIWRYFDDLITPEDNCLPPDNFQEQPPVGIAHRTSPTNIGMCLLSAMSAVDLEVGETARALQMIDQVLTAIEKLPKWHGHLYNWYDTRTTEPLHPIYISTVDSGNLAGALLILAAALRELRRDELADRAQALYAAMDFAPLYDESRRLFRIGLDLSNPEAAGGWYDLLASEARLSGFIAVARGDVERRHWRRLGRALVQKDRYRGMASWTGTMFEYLMPELIMPCYKDSLLYESIRFCVYVQKRRGAAAGTPWGISESAFFALDPLLSYRYKAHGCAALALKRGMDDELVVSPYSSFLALPVEPVAAISNLRRLRDMGVTGEYGFYEAVDFTDARRGSMPFEPVRCFMSHHLGMSMVAIDNLLQNGVWQRRFMADPNMAAFAGLLQEKVPVGGILLHKRETELPEKPRRVCGELYCSLGEKVDWISPSRSLLSNGAYHIMLTEYAPVTARMGNLCVYLEPRNGRPWESESGLWYRRDSRLYSLLPSVKYGRDTHFKWNLTPQSAVYTGENPLFTATTAISVSPGEYGERRVVSIGASSEASGELLFTFEPVLAGELDYVNHPAFYKLGMEARIEDGFLLIRRLSRGTLRERWLCLGCSAPMTLSCEREQMPGRLGLETAAGMEVPFNPGFMQDPFVCARVKAPLAQGESLSVTFALCTGRSREEALVGARKILADPGSEPAVFPVSYATLLGMDASDFAQAMALLRLISPPYPLRPQTAPLPKKALWPFGVSGDLPIVCVQTEASHDLALCEKLIRCHGLISCCGPAFDLVFLTGEGGDYLKPRATSLADYLRKLGRESSLGARGGVHFPTDHESLTAACVLLLSASEPLPDLPHKGCDPIVMSTNASNAYPLNLEYSWTEDNEFSFYVNNVLPPRAWGNILTNGALGYFATDCGTGHLWYENARECPINLWLNDPLAVSGNETLALQTEEELVSLFATPGADCRVTYGFGYARYEREIGGEGVSLEVFIPENRNARIFLIRSRAVTPLTLHWYLPLVLSGEKTDPPRIAASCEDGLFKAQSPDAPGRSLYALATTAPIGFTCRRGGWLTDAPNEDSPVYSDACFGAKYRLFPETPFVIACGFESPETLAELTEPARAAALLSETAAAWRGRLGKIQLKTPEVALDRLLNGWTSYQTLACRIWGRTSIYQSGGAFGFRDQLQDTVNLILMDKTLARDQILACCAHQYEEGDVMHWWHPDEGAGRGVRTRCSDDLLWLPWALCEYTEKTGDLALCGESVPYLSAPELAEGQHDRYESPGFSALSESVLDHCVRALKKILDRGVGAHDLLLMLGGDWNDGMDAVGAGGQGESVWLSWFFSATAQRFAALLKTQNRPEDAALFETEAKRIGEAANAAWDGQWYLRGYFDSGDTLGSSKDAFCRIDAIAQSFAAFCPWADKAKVDQALQSAVDQLFDKERGVVRLFTPPFLDSPVSPGYIESYGPGYRENGGQYTHGALWLAMACLRRGLTDQGLALLRAIIPETHDPLIYGAEPFVIAADVSAAAGREGRAGWSWYTGSSGWFYRIAMEELLGLHLRGGKLYIEPKLPSDWPACRVLLRRPDGSCAQIHISPDQITVDGAPWDGRGLEF